jgi:hypothetical protein
MRKEAIPARWDQAMVAVGEAVPALCLIGGVVLLNHAIPPADIVRADEGMVR